MSDDTHDDVTLACLVCGARLEPAMPGSEHNQPSGATVFDATGNYGSGVFDPMGTRERLEVNVCDACLTAAAAAGRVAHVRIEVRQPLEHVSCWNSPS